LPMTALPEAVVLTFTLASQDRNGNSTISFRSRARSGKLGTGVAQKSPRLPPDKPAYRR
jgi:hypothetical protein